MILQAAFYKCRFAHSTAHRRPLSHSHPHVHPSESSLLLSLSLQCTVTHLPTFVLTNPFCCTLSFSAANAFFSSACFFLKADNKKQQTTVCEFDVLLPLPSLIAVGQLWAVG